MKEMVGVSVTENKGVQICKKHSSCMLLLCLLLVGMTAGCAAERPAEPEQAEVAEEPEIDAGISVSGTVVEAAGKQVDLAEKNEYVRAIVRCRWVEQNKVAIEGRLAGGSSQELYLAVYDVVRELYCI